MKKYLSICMLLFTSILISQFVEHKPANNDWDIYPETEINYSNGKEDLKEILTLQSLLAEDRVDEMFKMMGKFGYIPIPNSENAYWKYTIDNNINENEMEPIIYIKNLGSNNNYYENYLQVFFSLIVKDNLSSGVSRNLKVNYKQAARMNNLFYNLFSFGNNYRTLKSTWDGSMGLDEGVSMEWEDRYTVKLTNPKKTSIYKASNFTPLSPFLRKREGYTTIVFNGPGKAYETNIELKKLSKNPNNTSEYFVPNVTFLSSVSDMSKTFKPESREPFNIDFFMSLENFNDRIWSDN